MATAIVSALTDIAVRRDVAMTGEITLRERVLLISGPKGSCWRRFAAAIPGHRTSCAFQGAMPPKPDIQNW